jgi:hypothetical protein
MSIRRDLALVGRDMMLGKHGLRRSSGAVSCGEIKIKDQDHERGGSNLALDPCS